MKNNSGGGCILAILILLFVPVSFVIAVTPVLMVVFAVILFLTWIIVKAWDKWDDKKRREELTSVRAENLKRQEENKQHNEIKSFIKGISVSYDFLDKGHDYLREKLNGLIGNTTTTIEIKSNEYNAKDSLAKNIWFTSIIFNRKLPTDIDLSLEYLFYFSIKREFRSYKPGGRTFIVLINEADEWSLFSGNEEEFEKILLNSLKEIIVFREIRFNESILRAFSVHTYDEPWKIQFILSGRSPELKQGFHLVEINDVQNNAMSERINEIVLEQREKQDESPEIAKIFERTNKFKQWTDEKSKKNPKNDVISSTKNEKPNITDEIIRMQGLLEKGILTEEEFSKLKNKLIND